MYLASKTKTYLKFLKLSPPFKWSYCGCNCEHVWSISIGLFHRYWYLSCRDHKTYFISGQEPVQQLWQGMTGPTIYTGWKHLKTFYIFTLTSISFLDVLFLKDLWSVYLWTYPWVVVRFVLCAIFPSKLVCCLAPMARIRQKACLDQVKCKFYRLCIGYDTIQNVKSATKIPNKLARR